jgi:Domain of unknown function (DUF5060)/Protein of unknown function (DUF4038)
MTERTVSLRTVAEWHFSSAKEYASPFADVLVEAIFTSPSGHRLAQPAFYDGNGVWKVRFNPGVSGDWRYELRSRPHDSNLTAEGVFTVTDAPARGFLKATPGDAWGFRFESGEPAFILGDTVYDIFGMAYNGGDVEGFIRRRIAQGFNLFRARVSVSRFHPPAGHCEWAVRRTWPWGGSETAPRFDLFNLDWFATVDRCMRLFEELGVGVELIMEGWGFEFPFNHRSVFTAEWEQLWMRYLIARYDAFNAVHFWTPLNEYEYYPNGDWHYKSAADRWALRIARWIKETAPHGHIVAMHNGPVLPPFAERFKADPEAVDAIMFQFWGSRDRANGWLAIGIEEQIAESLAGWKGSAVFAEWGYERNPELELKLPIHEFCDRSHTRRGAWRGAFSGHGIIHGFENSWSPWMILEKDQPGVPDLVQVRRFFTEIVPFECLRPVDMIAGDYPPGYRPLVLASPECGVVAVYYPAAGTAALKEPIAGSAQWFDPRSGAPRDAGLDDSSAIAAPADTDENGHPLDWVLVIRND